MSVLASNKLLIGRDFSQLHLGYHVVTPASASMKRALRIAEFVTNECRKCTKYLCDHIGPPISASSLRRIRSSQRNDLFIHRVRTTMAHYFSVTFLNPPPSFSFVYSIWTLKKVQVPIP